jgi:hypothetical protein
MKQIQPISIWDKGQNKQADILNAFGARLTLGVSATFDYTLSNEQEQLAKGELTMSGEDYQLWDADTFAWNWIAAQLNLTIIGDYVKPEPIVVEELAQNEPESEPIEEEEVVTESPVEPIDSESEV